jgi:hypothetical protein
LHDGAHDLPTVHWSGAVRTDFVRHKLRCAPCERYRYSYGQTVDLVHALAADAATAYDADAPEQFVRTILEPPPG